MIINISNIMLVSPNVVINWPFALYILGEIRQSETEEILGNLSLGRN